MVSYQDRSRRIHYIFCSLASGDAFFNTSRQATIHPSKQKEPKIIPTLVSFKRILCQAAQVLPQKPPAVHWLPFEANFFILQIKRGSIKASKQSSKHLTNPFGSFPRWKLEKMLESSSAIRVSSFLSNVFQAALSTALNWISPSSNFPFGMLNNSNSSI